MSGRKKHSHAKRKVEHPPVDIVSIRIQQTKTKLVAAMTSALGVVSTACKDVGCDRTMFYEYYNSDKVFAEKIDTIIEVSLDFAESKMFQRINGYSVKETKVFQHKGKIITKDVMTHYPPEPGLIKFYLATKGKKRGYVERHEFKVEKAGLDAIQDKIE